MRRMRDAWVAGVAVAALLGLAGCGFHLQGRVALSRTLAVVSVDALDEQSDFVQQLRRALTANGARLTARAADASAVIDVQRDEVTERVLSVSGRNLPREYELTYWVRFAVRSEGRELIEAETLSATRELSFDERAALAKEREQEIQTEALARDIASQVMARLATLP